MQKETYPAPTLSPSNGPQAVVGANGERCGQD
jgi:hypothetical protein